MRRPRTLAAQRVRTSTAGKLDCDNLPLSAWNLIRACRATATAISTPLHHRPDADLRHVAARRQCAVVSFFQGGRWHLTARRAWHGALRHGRPRRALLQRGAGAVDRALRGVARSRQMSGVRSVLLFLALGVFWLALLPPLFTRGECTAEFALATARLHEARPALGTLQQAQAYLRSQALPIELISAAQCESWPGIMSCAGGPVLLVSLPVHNRICRLYRDDAIRVQLGFNALQQLVRTETDMSPYGMLRLPLIGIEIDWAR
jgi:hypothetical protein